MRSRAVWHNPFLCIALLCLFSFVFSFVPIFYPTQAFAAGASLFVESAKETYAVGDTFKVSFYVNTSGQNINAIDADIRFPADKLQVVSPSAGTSLISVWTMQPAFSNSAGSLRFVGAIPNPGIVTSRGIISEVTFRVKSVGRATISFTDTSRVLLNDGKGTDVLTERSGFALNFTLPPPLGPLVKSLTHPDQETWYANNDAVINWQSELPGIDGYSYILDDNPITVPDNIVEGVKNSVAYNSITDGIHYFHIKALNDDVWGGVTHWAIKIDKTSPAQFKVQVAPAAQTSRTSPIISFATTDSLSGVNRYEIKIIPLTAGAQSLGEGGRVFFIEAGSPYIPELNVGKYDVVVRAYDGASNYSESIKRIHIVTTSLVTFSDEGVFFEFIDVTLPWAAFFFIVVLLLGGLGYGARRIRAWHHLGHAALADGVMQDPVIQRRLKVLKEKQHEYKSKAMMAIFIFILIGFSFTAQPVFAANSLPVPLVSLFSDEISNNELLYIGGAITVPQSTIVVYIQNQSTGEMFSTEVVASDQGEWFYSHSTFLQTGNYNVWVQARDGEISSAPSSQHMVLVRATAFEVGGSRISREFLLGAFVVILAIIICILMGSIMYHWRLGKKKHAAFKAKLHEVEQALRHNFGVLRHDIERELSIIQKSKAVRELSPEEQVLENKIHADLGVIRQHVDDDFWNLSNLG